MRLFEKWYEKKVKVDSVTVTATGATFKPGDRIEISGLQNASLNGSYTITKVRRHVFGIVPCRWWHYPLNWALALYWKAWALYWKLRAKFSN